MVRKRDIMRPTVSDFIFDWKVREMSLKGKGITGLGQQGGHGGEHSSDELKLPLFDEALESSGEVGVGREGIQ